MEKEYSEKGSSLHAIEHEHEEGESHYIDTPVDDEVEVEKQLMHCSHLDIDQRAEGEIEKTVKFVEEYATT